MILPRISPYPAQGIHPQRDTRVEGVCRTKCFRQGVDRNIGHSMRYALCAMNHGTSRVIPANATGNAPDFRPAIRLPRRVCGF